MLSFLKKKKKSVLNSAILRVRTATTNPGYMCGVQRVKPVLCLWVGGQAAAGAQWESLAPAGSSLDLSGSSTTPRNWHVCILGGGGRGGGSAALDRWHLKTLVTWYMWGIGPSQMDGGFLLSRVTPSGKEVSWWQAWRWWEGEEGLGLRVEVGKELGGMGSDTKGAARISTCWEWD